MSADPEDLWNDDGVVINFNGSNPSARFFHVATDNNYYFAAWNDGDVNNTKVLAQRINGDGLLEWNDLGSPAGALVDDSAADRRQMPLAAVEDGAGGLIILYQKSTADTGDIDVAIQRITFYGDREWGDGGVTIHQDTSAQSNPFSFGDLVRDADDNIFAIWSKEDGTIFAQKLNTNGEIQWDANGIQIGSGYTWGELNAAADGHGGVFVIMRDSNDDQALIQGVQNDGSLIWSDFFAVSDEDIGSAFNNPQLLYMGDGQVAAAWEEDRGGGTNVYTLVITNYWQIKNLSDLTPEDSSGDDISFGTSNGVRNNSEEVTVIDPDNDYPVSAVVTNMSYDRDWNAVTGDVDDTQDKAFVYQLTSADGASSTHTLYVPYDSSHESVTICPDATAIEEVTTDCTGAIVKTTADSDTSIETINGKQVWAVTGLTGTGGIGNPAATPAGSDPTQGLSGITTIDMFWPRDYTNETQPTLKFKKAQLSQNNVSGYEVWLDPGKNRSFHVGGLPATHSNQAYSVWRDDAEAKVVYLNEHDADTSNDEIQVYFKALSSQSLTEGEHGWRVKVANDQNEYQEYNQGFSVDTTSLTYPLRTISGSTQQINSSDYSLPVGSVVQVLGSLKDEYRGSVPTYTGGGSDTFTAVAAGSRSVSLLVKKLTFGLPKTPLAIYSDFDQANFNVTQILDEKTQGFKLSSFALNGTKQLSAGNYLISLTSIDNAGNESTQAFYVNVGIPTFVLPDLPDAPNPFGETLTSEVVGTTVVPVASGANQVIESTDLSIKVVDEDGNPLSGVVVTITGGQTATTDENGEVVFSGLVRGAYVVELTQEGTSTRQSIEINPGMKAQSFTFALGSTQPMIAIPPLLPRIEDGNVIGAVTAYSASFVNLVVPAVGIAALTLSYGQGLSLKLLMKVLQALGLLAHGKPQGIVFNSKDSTTVPFALLTVKSAHNDADKQVMSPITETLVSNAFGVYHGISLPKGLYTMTAAHQDFVFPATKPLISYLTHKEYYRGELFDVASPKQQQFFLVPLDPRVVGKMAVSLVGQLRLLVSRLSLLNFGVPLMTFSLVIAVLYPSILNWGIATVYGLLLLKTIPDLFKQPTVKGQVVDQAGKPLSEVVIRLGAVDGNSFTAIVTTDKQGNFKLFAPKDTYQINAFKPGFEWQRQGSPLGFEEVDARQRQVQLNLVMQPVVTA